MAQTTIPGTRTLWSVIRGYLNDMFTEIYGKVANLSGTNTGDETTATIKTKLGITTLSGSNTGDQDLSGYTTTSALSSGLSGKEVKSLLSQTFAGELNLSTGGEVSYKIYASNAALTPTVAANPVENSAARVVIDAGASASFVDTNLGTKRAGSDDFTVSKQNELLVFVTPDGTAGALVLSYTIKVLN